MSELVQVCVAGVKISGKSAASESLKYLEGVYAPVENGPLPQAFSGLQNLQVAGARMRGNCGLPRAKSRSDGTKGFCKAHGMKTEVFSKEGSRIGQCNILTMNS